MRRILLAASALVLSTGAAMAADSASIAIDALQAPTCDITTVSASITLAGLDVAVPGTFEYVCNFVGDPTLNFVSTNGGVVTAENGGGSATYGIWLNTAAPGGPPSSWLQSLNTPQAYTGITTSNPANVVVTPVFQVGLTSALPVAGAYSDTLTISISP